MGVAVPRAPGVRNPLKSLVMGPSLLVNCYLEIKFHKKIRVNHPPPPPPLTPFNIFLPSKENIRCSDCLYQIHLQLEATLQPTQMIPLILAKRQGSICFMECSNQTSLLMIIIKDTQQRLHTT